MKFRSLSIAVLTILMSCANSGTKQLAGSGVLAEYWFTLTAGNPGSRGKQLPDTGDFRLDINIVTSDRKMESEEGSLVASVHSLKIEIVSGIVATELKNPYDLDNGIFVLSPGMPGFIFTGSYPVEKEVKNIRFILST